MEDTERTLVILLSMHRSGSSLTSNVFMEQGLSLGPWELCPANPTNLHGHFEAIPILEVTLPVQNLIYGFRDDLPETEEALAAFLTTEGRWDDWAEQVPEEYVQRGRSLIRTLLDSGKISGFKDPRTILLWPFWRRVLSAFPEVRVVPVALLRSPHEIAMSLFTKFNSRSGYWTCLDVVAVHFRQLQAIIESWNHPVPRVRFGGPDYFGDLEQAVRTCGLDWDPNKAARVFDESCIHHVPAVVSHRAQHLYDSLTGAAPAAPDAEKNAVQLEADERARDRLHLDRLQQSRVYAEETAETLRLTKAYAEETDERMRLTKVYAEETDERMRLTKVYAEETDERMRLTKAYAEETDERLRLTRAYAEETVEALRLTQVRLDQETESRKLLERQLQLTEERSNQSVREAIEVWVTYQELRAYVDRLKAHPVLSLALKGRREVRNLVSRLKARHNAG